VCAAAIVGFNPIVLRWGVEPVSGIAAALFVVLALGHVLDGTEPRHGRRAGVWLGLAFMMAYQTLLVIGAIMALALVRDFRRRPRYLLAMFAAFSVLVGVQCVLDRLYYGVFGISVAQYVLENTGTHVAKILWDLQLRDVARWLYNLAYEGSDLAYQQSASTGELAVKSSLPGTWYAANLPRCLVWPTIALVLAGIVRVLRRPRWSYSLLLAVIAINVAIMSIKGSKDFRLWLPFLPLIAVFGGLGFAWFGQARLRTARFGLGLVTIASIAAFGLAENLATNTRRFGGLWRAMELINRVANEDWADRERRWQADRDAAIAVGADPEDWPEETPLVGVSSAFHWSMFLRNSPRVDLVKLPHYLDGWKHYGEEQRQKDFAAIADLEWFVVHLPILTGHPDLFEVVNRDFRVYAVFYDREVYEGLGPIYVLCKRGTARHEVPFFETEFEVAPQPRLFGGRGLRFERENAENALEQLTLLDFEYTPLPGDGHGWMTFTWRGGPFTTDYTIRQVIAGPDGVNAFWQQNAPAYGMLPTSAWGPDRALREGYLVVSEQDAFALGGPSRRLGGEYRRGDLIPALLWTEIAVVDPKTTQVRDRMLALDPLSAEPIELTAPPGGWTAAQGGRTSAEGLTLAGRFFLPVHAKGRRPDDGNPIPLEE
jgi:MFS family permease